MVGVSIRITQKKTYNKQNMAKVWNQEWLKLSRAWWIFSRNYSRTQKVGRQ